MKRWYVLALVASIALFNVPPVQAATTSKLTVVGIAGDAWYNYDFNGEVASSTNVDWPTMMIFYGNAEVDKVKNAYSPWYPKRMGDVKNAAMNDVGTWFYDSDRGIKKTDCPPTGWFEHMRVYAPGGSDRMYNTNYGYWIMGTTHFDYNDGCSGAIHGYSETAESWFAQNARNIWGSGRVFEDWGWMFNGEPRRPEGNHIWESNGYSSYVNVP